MNRTVFSLAMRESRPIFPAPSLSSGYRMHIVESDFRLSTEPIAYSSLAHKYSFFCYRSCFSRFLSHPFELSSASFSSQLFNSQQNISSNASFSLCTFKNCSSMSGSGGAIYISDSTLTLSILDCFFINCSAEHGGAIGAYNSASLTVLRCCAIYSQSSSYGVAFDIYIVTQLSFNSTASVFSSSTTTDNYECNVLGSVTQVDSNNNFSNTNGLASVAAVLLTADSASQNLAQFITVSNIAGANGIVGLRGSSSSYSMTITSSNFYNLSFGSEGLFQLQGGSGHFVKDSIMMCVSGSYFVGWRSDYSVSCITFSNCVSDQSFNSSAATVYTQSCLITASTATIAINVSGIKMCFKYTDIFTEASIGGMFSQTTLFIMLDLILLRK